MDTQVQTTGPGLLPDNIQPTSDKYFRLYSRLIQKRRKEVLVKKNGVYEKHHITPRCMGGTNADDNLIILTPREHYVAHLILCRIYKGTPFYEKLLSAVIYMVGSRERFVSRRELKFNSRVYEATRTQYAVAKHGFFSRFPKELQEKLRKAVSARMKGKHLPEEWRRKIGEGLRGRKMSPEWCKAMAARMKIRMEPLKRRVRCVETGVVYESVMAAEAANPKSPLVSKCCRGKVESSGGLHFEFVDPELVAQFSKKKRKPKDEYVYAMQKPVFCVELDQEFKSLRDCADELERRGFLNSIGNPIAPYTIRNVANGKFPECGGLHFKWLEHGMSTRSIKKDISRLTVKRGNLRAAIENLLSKSVCAPQALLITGAVSDDILQCAEENDDGNIDQDEIRLRLGLVLCEKLGIKSDTPADEDQDKFVMDFLRGRRLSSVCIADIRALLAGLEQLYKQEENGNDHKNSQQQADNRRGR